MTAARRSISASSAWDRICSGRGLSPRQSRPLADRARAGDRLGSMRRFWRRACPRLQPRPGWRFAEEYYDQRRWLACRRGALWEAARENGPRGAAHGAVARRHHGRRDPGQRQQPLPLCLRLVRAQRIRLPRSACCEPGMVFVDVGANDGYYTLFAARRVGPSGRVRGGRTELARAGSTCSAISAATASTTCTVVPAAHRAPPPALADLHLAQGVHAGHNTLGSFAHDDVVRASLERVPIETARRGGRPARPCQGRLRQDRRRGRRSQRHRRRGDGAERDAAAHADRGQRQGAARAGQLRRLAAWRPCATSCATRYSCFRP